jgi:hypothetical protein
MTRGLVGYWEFDEGTGQTAYDGSNNSNNGQLGSTASSDDNDPSWTGDGKNGGGMDFDGVNDYVDVPDSISLDITSAITIEAWIKWGGSATHRGAIWDDWDWVTPKQSVQFRINTDNTIRFLVSSNGGATEDYMQTIDTIDNINWYHIAVTYNAGDAKIYINGNESISDTLTETSIYNSNNTKFIGKYDSSSEFFNGSIDSVRIYNRALSADEVRYHYNRGGPVGSWNFDEGSGLTAFDGTGNNNDGTITDATWTTGKYNSALSFDGTGTLSSWVNITDDSGFSGSAKSDDAGTISWFTRRKEITITTNGTSTPANYQVELTIAHETAMNTNFEDIRFNTKAGGYIDYWIESEDGSTATVWIELPDAITHPGSDEIWMYYGNGVLSDGGDGDDVFIFFEDMNGDMSKWTVTGGTVEIVNNKMVLNGVGDAVRSNNLLPVPPYRVDITWQSSSTNIQWGFGTSDLNVGGDGSDSAQFKPWNTGFIFTAQYKDGIRTQADRSGQDNAIQTGQIAITNNEVIYYWNDFGSTATQSTNVPDEAMYLYAWWNQYNPGYIYDFRVRKYIANEPTPITYGTEVSSASQAIISKNDSYSLRANSTTAYATINDNTISSSITAGWNYITLTYNKDADGSEDMKLYINGTEAATGDYSTV